MVLVRTILQFTQGISVTGTTRCRFFSRGSVRSVPCVTVLGPECGHQPLVPEEALVVLWLFLQILLGETSQVEEVLVRLEPLDAVEEGVLFALVLALYRSICRACRWKMWTWLQRQTRPCPPSCKGRLSLVCHPIPRWDGGQSTYDDGGSK